MCVPLVNRRPKKGFKPHRGVPLVELDDIFYNKHEKNNIIHYPDVWQYVIICPGKSRNGRYDAVKW